MLTDKERKEATVLLRAKGPYAGVLLALRQVSTAISKSIPR